MAVKSATKRRAKVAKRKERYEYVMSDQCRRSAKVKSTFLTWVKTNPKFKTRRPTPDDVVSEARKKNSPIRCIIEQNVQKAASKHWYEEAQYLLRHMMIVRIDVRTSKAITKPIPAFIPIKINRDGSIDEDNYIPAARVAASPTMSESVCDKAHGEFLAWMERWSRYDEFLKAFSPVLAAYRKVEGNWRDAG